VLDAGGAAVPYWLVTFSIVRSTVLAQEGATLPVVALANENRRESRIDTTDASQGVALRYVLLRTTLLSPTSRGRQDTVFVRVSATYKTRLRDTVLAVLVRQQAATTTP